MKIHCFQHVPFEGPGSIEHWAKRNSAHMSATTFYQHTVLPKVHEFDWLIVMGGPMSANDEHTYPWLREEKKFIAEAIAQGKFVLGVCLGAQLIANALGAEVLSNRDREIGWFPIEYLPWKENSIFGNIFQTPMEVFHWHGETFELPAHAVRIARSEGCDNQAFCVGDRVLGLQFHLEATPLTVKSLIEHCHDDLVPGRYVQSAEELLSVPSRFKTINLVMDSLLDYWESLHLKK